MDAAAPRRPRLRLTLLGAALIAALVVGALLAAPARGGLEEAVDGLGAAGALAFVAVYAVATVAMLPASVLSLASGALFGIALGSAVTVAGATLGAGAAFLAGRRLSRPSVEAIAGPNLRRLDRHLADRGLLSVLVLRLVPLIPFNAFNYAASATAVPLRAYLLGTLVGIVPGSIAVTAAGAGLGDPTSPGFLAALAALAALTLAGGIAARRMRRREGAAAPQTDAG